jgi:hypothetical protein
MRRALPLLLVLMQAVPTVAQYGNEWIDHTLRYWRFNVFTDGLHRIDSTALANAGFPVASVDPQHIMVFGREAQVPIYISDGGDGVLNAGDFIEFHAQKNDGWLDRLMYAAPQHQANPYYSLVNDTIRYFITWSPDAPKQRIVPYVNTAFDDHVPRTWFWGETVVSTIQTGNNGYKLGAFDSQSNASSGFYLEAEGRFGGSLVADNNNPVQEQTITVNTPRAYTGADAPPARVQAVSVSVSRSDQDQGQEMNHHLRVGYGPAPGSFVVDTIFQGVRVIRSTFEVPASALGANLPVRYQVRRDLMDPGGEGYSNPNYVDEQAVSNTVVRYARDMNLGNPVSVMMWHPAHPDEPLVRMDFNGIANTPILYVWGDTLRRIEPTSVGGGFWRALFPAHMGMAETRAFVQRANAVTQVTALSPAGTNGYFTDMQAVQQDSAMLIVTHASLMNGASAYADYRRNLAPERNRHNVLLMDVDELYDQFGGGIPKHHFAIRRMAKFTLEQWDTRPKALFLIGKSVQTPHINSLTPGIRPNTQGSYARCLVPTYGYPSCDACFTIGLVPGEQTMSIPVGRISAETNDAVLAYLDKVRVFEAQPPAAWMKNILHFRGGFNAGEQALLAAYLNGLEVVAEDTCFGGRVTNFMKTSSNIFEQASADSVRMFIQDEGVTMMTFFAHAYSQDFDITIEDPALYDWNGKHPMILANSCYIGNIHQNSVVLTAPEKWVLMPNKGPVAFLATVGAARPYTLFQYSYGFYNSFSRLNHAKSIGTHMREAVQGLLPLANDMQSLGTAHGFTLHGDPTLILNSWPQPDYVITDSDILFAPDPVTADDATFQVKAVVRNIGRALNNTVHLALERTNPVLGTETYHAALTNLYLQDTAYFDVPTLAQAGGQGANTIQVRVDLDPDLVPEVEDVMNNVANAPLFITSGDLIPVYPYDYAIVPDPQPVLKASTGDPFAPERTYVLQIDTTDLFNSPVLESVSITAPGGVVTWQPQSIYSLNAFQDSTVFFWRCSIDSTGNGGYGWYERSFQYIAGKEGWGQAHYFQFKNDAFSGVIYDRPNREFDFHSGQRNMRARVHDGYSSPLTGWDLDLTPQDYNGCGSVPAWHVAVIEPVTFEPWGNNYNGSNPHHVYGDFLCGGRVRYFFTFRTNSASELEGMRSMLLDSIPHGHHILAYTWLYLDKAGMANNAPGLMPAITSLGAPGPDFAAMHDSSAYIFYVRKGYPETFRDTLAPAVFPPGDDGVIELSQYVNGVWDRGTITTMLAGPASAWHGLYWNEVPRQPEDSTRIKLIGVTTDGAEIELLDNPSVLDSVPDLGALVSAAQYPWLKIKGAFHDLGSPQPQLDPAQLERWQLLASPVPECAIHPPLGYHNALNDLFQGQDASVAVAVQNIGPVDMDSLLMTAWVTDRNNVTHRVHYKVNAPLPVGAVLIDTVRFSTLPFGGPNTLVIEANPIDTTTGQYHQWEQHHFNNIARLRFNVDVDRENPLLDVTFDGVHILDGDIVSARPEIVITLDDENPVLLLDSPADTARFKVFLTPPDGATKRLYFRDGAGNDLMRFQPAEGTDNICRIHYSAHFPTDGKYMLAVQASDRSNNTSGDHDYRISFEVINRPTITEVLNYPNPFTTSTRFVFTLTGLEPPSHMKIQIMTITGKVVREIGMHELGPIRVGRNITEFAWDGTDQFGDRLARGVYLYRVQAQLNGQDIEYRGTGAAGYFTKGFGKMYLLR